MSEFLSAQTTAHSAVPVRYERVAALHATSSGNAPVVLLVPGYTGSKEDFAPLFDPIAADGLDVVAIDLPGQYESPGPDDEPAYLPAALGVIVAELVGKLAAEGRTVLLLGHSYGGLVARAAVLAGAPIAGLTLLDSGPSELPAGPRRQMLDLAEVALRKHGLHAVQKMREALDPTAWSTLPTGLQEFLRERFIRSTVPGLLGMANGLRQEPDLVGALARTLRTTGTPCLVVCGANDDAWPVSTQRDMADRLDADFAVIPDAAHTPNVENPKALLATLLPTWHTWLP